MLKQNVRRLTTLGLLIALDVVLTRFFSYMLPGNLDRISLQFLPHSLGGMLFGPIYAAISCIAGDILGMLINSAGLSFSPLITLSAGIRGLIYGFILYKKPVTLLRCIVAACVVTAVVDLGLNPIWMKIMYGQGYLAILTAKIPVRLIYGPVAGLVMYPVLKRTSEAIDKKS
ncbi:MAG: folate family ECF transporter S component [Clostridiales bacterium]|nr:folate family ECF transporter S component [Clostridiales bacterium]